MNPKRSVKPPSSPRRRLVRASIAVIALAALARPLAADSSIDLLDLAHFEPSRFDAKDASATPRSVGERRVLRLETGHSTRWPGVTIAMPDGARDLSAHANLSVEFRNAGDRRVELRCRVDNPGADGTHRCTTESESVAPGDRGVITVPLVPRVFTTGEIEFIGMRGPPPVFAELDPANVTAIVLFVADPDTVHAIEIESVRAEGSAREIARSARDAFFPFIDELGQFLHADWPGKTRSVDELVASNASVDHDLDRMVEPGSRNRYGGWTAGPQLEATGFFRVVKYEGSWWLVDPDGRLFWSHGVDCVHPSTTTPISDREQYFRGLPSTSSPLARFYGKESWAPHGYYRDHTPYRTYDFFRANQFRKYGETWETTFVETTHRRLRNWGLNTIGNWSDSRVCHERRTPYVAATSTAGVPRLEGSQGHWGKFPDVFSPTFGAVFRARLEREQQGAISDPWCIGFFVDNELSWGDETSLASATLKSPAEQPAKQAFVADLEAKYKTIEALNAAWGTTHASWQALGECCEVPTASGARDDLLAFYRRTAETYFRTLRDTLRAVAPEQLYLGCRFAWVNDAAARAATKFCDVVSYNRYATSVAEHRLPGGIDRPVIIGEFHFGALDRGLFHTGLRKARNQEHRAALYESYVRGALTNPQIVGTHWFQWKDQATTGRGDGENYQIGFIDVCDRPYPELVGAARRVAETMYSLRLGGDAPGAR